jgi:hypothetical protein
MSIGAIQAAFELELATMAGDLPTQFGNAPFDIPDGPYQRVDLVPADPDNPTMGDDYYRDTGFFQVMLRYPLGQGTGAALDRAHDLRRHFKRGRVLQHAGVSVVIAATPAIRAGLYDSDRYCVPVRIAYFAHQTGA